jgi:hypothetical protein
VLTHLESALINPPLSNSFRIRSSENTGGRWGSQKLGLILGCWESLHTGLASAGSMGMPWLGSPAGVRTYYFRGKDRVVTIVEAGANPLAPLRRACALTAICLVPGDPPGGTLICHTRTYCHCVVGAIGLPSPSR